MSEMKIFTKFVGIIKKIQTISTGDGDYRITIDIPKTCAGAVKELMDVQDQVCGFGVAKSDKPIVESKSEPFEPF